MVFRTRPTTRCTRRAPTVTVDPGPVGDRLEGEFRPGFFRGVLTVVVKLFALTRPTSPSSARRTRSSSPWSAAW